MGLFGNTKKKKNQSEEKGEVLLSDGNSYTLSKRVDCLGDSCPRPQLMTKKALAEVSTGDVVEVCVDNPSSMEAIPPMLGALSATHLETVKAERCWLIYVRKN
jgi:tRNA 2-thiouridine synthesizing protein A